MVDPHKSNPRNETRRELSRAESRLEARTRELDLIQSLARRAAEARTAAELFSSAISVLEQGEDLDVAVAAHALDGEVDVVAFLGRPVSDTCLAEMVAEAAKLLDWAAEQEPACRRLELESHDAERGPLQRVAREDLVILPILRRERPVACLVVAPSRRATEGPLRLLYSAANQLSLHLERILTVREAEADRFRSILDSMPQAVLLTDHELRPLQVNRSALELFERLGLAEGDDRVAQAVARLDLGRLVAPVRDGQVGDVDGELSLDGNRILTVTVSPFIGEPGEGRGLVLVISDVTESRRLQERLAQSERMSSLGQMISGVAHELNNPLTSVVGYAQLLDTAAGDERSRRHADLLQQEAERCRKIVQNLLSFARRRDSERKPVSLNEVVRSVLTLMGYQLKVAGITVETELSVDLPPIRGDAHQLQQALVNLVTNAQHAVQEQSGGRRTIRLFTSPAAGGSVRLEVGDSGPGIPADMRSRIFDPFFTTKGEGRGTGLGLSIVYDIVRDHEGTITALPSDRGAVFRITLPAAGVEARRPSPGPRGTPESVAPGRILVVEDEGPLAQMICDVLAEDGHLAQSVSDGAQALARLGEEFDLIISDLKMPGMDGERLHEAIRRERPDLAERLLLITGDTIGTDPQRLAERTGLVVLLKPFRAGHLRDAVRAKLRSSREGH